jgi:hypothetical protein
MVYGLHMHTWNRMMKPLSTTLSGVGSGLRRGDGMGDLTKVRYQNVQFYSESSQSIPTYTMNICQIK